MCFHQHRSSYLSHRAPSQVLFFIADNFFFLLTCIVFRSHVRASLKLLHALLFIDIARNVFFLYVQVHMYCICTYVNTYLPVYTCTFRYVHAHVLVCTGNMRLLYGICGNKILPNKQHIKK